MIIHDPLKKPTFKTKINKVTSLVFTTIWYETCRIHPNPSWTDAPGAADSASKKGHWKNDGVANVNPTGRIDSCGFINAHQKESCTTWCGQAGPMKMMRISALKASKRHEDVQDIPFFHACKLHASPQFWGKAIRVIVLRLLQLATDMLLNGNFPCRSWGFLAGLFW